MLEKAYPSQQSYIDGQVFHHQGISNHSTGYVPMHFQILIGW